MGGEPVRGTLVCAVTGGDESNHAVELGLELSARLGLRLVLAHAVHRADDGRDDRTARHNSGTDYERAQHWLAQLAQKHGVIDLAERRVALGDPAVLLGRIAAEEAADVVVVGAGVRGWRQALDLGLAGELETETRAPVIVAVPRKRRGRRNSRRR
jgi:nucleotide-binding universal stress UspA family protein